MLFLSMVAVAIVLGQNTNALVNLIRNANEIVEIQTQVRLRMLSKIDVYPILKPNRVLHYAIVQLIKAIFLIQVRNAAGLYVLVQRLQEERAAVALNIFMNRTSVENTVDDLQKYVTNGLNISKFSLRNVSIEIYCVSNKLKSKGKIFVLQE